MFNRYTNAVNNCVREGTVSAVYPQRHSARVTFEDRDGLVSSELPILTNFAHKNKAFNMVDVGDRVVCLCVSNDLTSGGGYIIGAIFSGWDLPVVNDQDVTQVNFSDGAYFTYNRRTHVFQFKSAEGSTFTHNGANGDLTIENNGNIKISGHGWLKMDIDKRIDINGGDNIWIRASGDIIEKGSNIRLN